MSEKREYMATDYQRARLSILDDTQPHPNDDVVLSALRIASQVMRPGVIEDVLVAEQFEDEFASVAAAIRKALLGETEDEGR